MPVPAKASTIAAATLTIHGTDEPDEPDDGGTAAPCATAIASTVGSGEAVGDVDAGDDGVAGALAVRFGAAEAAFEGDTADVGEVPVLVCFEPEPEPEPDAPPLVVELDPPLPFPFPLPVSLGG